MHYPTQLQRYMSFLFNRNYIDFTYSILIFKNILTIVYIAQEMITSFRFKLAIILLCWKTNTASMTTIVKETDDDTNGDLEDVYILESLDDIKNSKQKIPLTVEMKYRSI